MKEPSSTPSRTLMVWKEILVLCLLSGPSFQVFLISFFQGRIGNKIQSANKEAKSCCDNLRNYCLLFSLHTLARSYCPKSAPTALNPPFFRVWKTKRPGFARRWLRCGQTSSSSANFGSINFWQIGEGEELKAVTL